MSTCMLAAGLTNLCVVDRAVGSGWARLDLGRRLGAEVP